MTRTGNKNLRQRFHSQPETHFFDRPPRQAGAVRVPEPIAMDSLGKSRRCHNVQELLELRPAASVSP